MGASPCTVNLRFCTCRLGCIDVVVVVVVVVVVDVVAVVVVVVPAS